MSAISNPEVGRAEAAPVVLAPPFRDRWLVQNSPALSRTGTAPRVSDIPNSDLTHR